MREGWKECKLGEVVESISETYKFQPREKVVFLNTSDIYLGQVINHQLVDSATLPGQAKKRIKKDDFLFSEIRPANGRYAAIDFKAENYVVSTKLMVLRCNEKIDLDYFSFFLTSKDQLDYLQMIAEDRSGTFPQITFDHISNLPILLPPLPEQRAIASVLSSLDDKIDLLHRQNKTLESMAETLFRQWFVEEAEEDWAEKILSDIAEHKKISVQPSRNLTTIYYHYSIPAFDGNGKQPVVQLGAEIQSNKYHVFPNTILISKLNPRFPRVWAIPSSIDKDSICSTEFQVISPINLRYYGFIYSLLKSRRMVDELIGAASGTSSSHQRVKPEDILNIRFKMPSEELLNRFDDITLDYWKKIQANATQIRTLSALRDTLLPKLMSGEVRVSL